MERGEIVAQLEEIARDLEARQRLVNDAYKRRRELILAAAADGMSDVEIAAAAGVKRQYVERLRSGRPRRPQP